MLAEANAHVTVAVSGMKRNATSLAYGQGAEVLSPEAAPLRWFLLPSEVKRRDGSITHDCHVRYLCPLPLPVTSDRDL